MSKMTLKQKRDQLIKMCSIREELKTNEQLVQEVIKERLIFIPHQKLYKFRTCSNQNLKALEENCIWMSLASNFHDSFDNTINIDPKENIKEIEKWLKENYPVFCFDLAKKFYEQNGISIPYTHEDFEEYISTCLDKNGDPIEEKEQAFLIAHASQEELEHMDSIFQQLKLVREKLVKIEDKTVQNIADIINRTRTEMRDRVLVYCMTERYDNHTLWENYAKNYTGFCIEYCFRDFCTFDFQDYKNLVYLFPMTYRKKKPCFNMVPVMEGILRQFIYKDDGWAKDSELDADFNMQLLYKDSDYEYECEWRFSINADDSNIQSFPFVSAIYAGKDISSRNLSRLIKIANKLRVPIYKQEINRSMNGYDYKIVKESKL